MGTNRDMLWNNLEKHSFTIHHIDFGQDHEMKSEIPHFWKCSPFTFGSHFASQDITTYPRILPRNLLVLDFFLPWEDVNKNVYHPSILIKNCLWGMQTIFHHILVNEICNFLGHEGVQPFAGVAKSCIFLPLPLLRIPEKLEIWLRSPNLWTH